jgi:hypothetical protein
MKRFFVFIIVLDSISIHVHSASTAHGLIDWLDLALLFFTPLSDKLDHIMLCTSPRVVFKSIASVVIDTY